MTVLVDTSVWIRFFAGREPFAGALDALLDREDALAHDLVFGELLVGDTGRRSRFLGSYGMLLHAPLVPHHEVVEFVRARRLQGRGIGWIDAHLLASTLVAGARLWTADARLAALATALRVSHRTS